MMRTTTITKTLFLMLFILSLGIAKGQSNKTEDYKSKITDSNANFYDIVAQKRAEFRTLDLSIKKNNKAFKQFERWAYIWKDRINSDGSFPEKTKQLNKSEYLNLLFEDNTNISNRNVSSSPWEQIGPIDNPAQNGYAAYPGKGRINVVAVDTNNSQIMYAGSAAGGIWKSTDGGNHWLPKSDTFAGLGVTDILIDPNDSNVIYLATGDEDGWNISSIGLFKSTDAGNTWTATGLTFALSDYEYIRDIAFLPGSSTTLFALTNSEIRKSTDGGATWVNSPTGTFFTERFTDIVFDPDDSSKVIVSDYWNGLYVSTDSGDNFIIHGVFGGGNSRDFLKLTTTPNDPDHFYAISQNGEFRKYRFAIDHTASDLISTTAIANYNPQGGYNMCIAVSPTDKNNIMIGGVRGYKSTDNGTSFSVLLNPYDNPPGVGFYVHPDHHHLSFLPDGVTVINGHDGGVHKGLFSATTGWTDLSNTLNITQPYNIAVTQESNGDNFIMANQDNDGFSKVLKDGTRQWVSAAAGDGTAAGIDYNTPDTRYLGGTRGALYRSDDGWSSSYVSATVILSNDNDAAFVSPMLVHPTTPTTIYAAHSDVKKSTNRGNSFTSLNSGLSGVNFIDISTNGASTRIYAISQNGDAKRSDNDGVSWTTITPPAGVGINSFAAMPNTTTVYATASGYNSGNKVYKSVDNGATWTNISAGLPNIIMKKILIKTNLTNETLFLGTELGVYWKNNTMTDWVKFGTGLPNVIITDLKINYTDELLYVGTFGRGMWRASVDDTALGIDQSVFSPLEMPTIYPNPTTDNIIKVSIPNRLLDTNDKLNYIIYNTVGGIIKEGDLMLEENTIHVNNLSSGMYMMRIFNSKNYVTNKILIE